MRELKHSVVRFNYLNSRIQTLKQNNYHLHKAIIDLIATQHNAVMLYIGSAGISVARSKDYCFTIHTKDAKIDPRDNVGFASLAKNL